MASQNVERTRARLEKRIEEGAYYEAHQQLRVVTQRYVKARNFDSAVGILSAGAHALLKSGQHASAGDLCLLLVDVYRQGLIKPSHVSKSTLLELLTKLPPEEPSRKRFINEILLWSSKLGEFPAGDPELHHFVGNLFAQDDEVYEAEKHFILGTRQSAEALTQLLYDWYKENDAHTAPQYIARAVFGYLLIGNLANASRSLEIFIDRLVHDNPELVVQNVESAMSDLKIFPSLPLLNFLNLLVLGAQAGGQDVYRNLASHYHQKLKEVPAWDEALEQVGEIYFDIQVRRQHNIFDMMGNLFGGGPPEPSREITDTSLD